MVRGAGPMIARPVVHVRRCGGGIGRIPAGAGDVGGVVMSRAGAHPTESDAAAHESRLDRWLAPDDRRALSKLIDDLLTVLAIAFTLLLILQFVVPLPRWLYRQVNLIGIIIWIIFAIDFGVRLALARSKLDYLKHNWLSAIAIAMPALRVFRVVRLFAVMRSGANADVIVGFNRGRRVIARLAQRGGSLYVIGLTIVVCLLTALGEYLLERTHKDADITTYGEALWFVAGTLTTVGTEDDPVTVEGRILAVLLMMYGLGLAGWITAQVASILLGQGGQLGGSGGGGESAPDAPATGSTAGQTAEAAASPATGGSNATDGTGLGAAAAVDAPPGGEATRAG